MDIKLIKYIQNSLRDYREVSYGQFDQVTKYKVETTQDGADAIEFLLKENERLTKELVKKS
jgi:hypothetical protein